MSDRVPNSDPIWMDERMAIYFCDKKDCPHRTHLLFAKLHNEGVMYYLTIGILEYTRHRVKRQFDDYLRQHDNEAANFTPELFSDAFSEMVRKLHGVPADEEVLTTIGDEDDG